MLDADRIAAAIGKPLDSEHSLSQLLKRPEVQLEALRPWWPDGLDRTLVDHAVTEQVEIQTKYEGYIERQRHEVERAGHQEALPIPPSFDFAGVAGLSIEVRQRLEAARPETLGAASRVPGMTPAAVSLLLVNLKRANKARRATA